MKTIHGTSHKVDRKRVALAILFSVLCFASEAQSTWSNADSLGSQTVPSADMTITADGGRIRHHASGNVINLTKFDDSGVPVWSTEVSTTSAYYVMTGHAPDAQGGIFIAGQGPIAQRQASWSDPDTITFDILVIHVDQQGAVAWQRHYQRTHIYPYNGGVNIGFPHHIRIVSDGAGGLIGTSYMQVMQPMRIIGDLIHFDEQGNLLTAQAFGHMPPGETYPILPYDIPYAPYMITGSSNGTLTVAFRSISGPVDIPALYHFDANGDLRWSRKITCSALPLHFLGQGICSAPNEGCLFTFLLTTTSNWWGSLRLDSSGVCQEQLIVERPHYPGRILVFPGSDGSHLLLGTPSLYDHQSLVRLDSAGGAAERHDMSRALLNGNQRFTYWTDASLNADRLHLTGTQRTEDPLLGVVNERYTGAKVDVDSLADCSWRDSTVTSYRLPGNTFIAIPLADQVSIAVDSAYSVLPNETITAVALPIPSIEELCGTTTSVQDQTTASHLDPWPCPAARGTTVRMTLEDEAGIQLLDSQGRLVASFHSTGPTMEIPTTGLEPGCFLVRSITKRGKVLYGRFVVE